MRTLYSIVLLLLCGCGASYYSAETNATYIMPDGTRIQYSSTKEQQNLKFTYNPTTKNITVSVEHSNTQVEAIEAAFRNSVIQNEIIKELILKGAALSTIP